MGTGAISASTAAQQVSRVIVQPVPAAPKVSQQFDQNVSAPPGAAGQQVDLLA